MAWFSWRRRERAAAVPARVEPTVAPAYRRSGRAVIPAMARADFMAADAGRLTADWLGLHRDANATLRGELRTMRGRSRERAANDGYMHRFLRLVDRNVVGPQGIRLQMDVRNPDGSRDERANELIEAAWADWCRRGECTMEGEQSWLGVQSAAATTTARDGEILLRHVTGPAADNRFGFRLQLLEADHLDENDNRRLADGREVIMGVEVGDWSRRLAYHVATRHPGRDAALGSPGVARERMRLPAESVTHVMLADRVGQVRAAPWAFAALYRLRMMGGYEEAELVAARVAAAKMGFIVSPDGDGFGGAGVDEKGNTVMDAEAGSLEQLPAGADFKPWDPTHPTDAFKPFMQAMLLGTVAAMDVSYHGLTGDLTGANYSSLRQGALDERDAWRQLQRWEIETACDPVFRAWLTWSLTMGAIPGLPLARFDKYCRPTWRPRGWQWVDPEKEMNGKQALVAGGLSAPSYLAAELGVELEDVLKQWQADKALFAKYGVPFDFWTALKGKTAPAGAPSDGGSSDAQDGSDDQVDQDGQARPDGGDRRRPRRRG